jgi:hypothetical protein
MFAHLPFLISGLIGVAIVLIGVRFLLAPQTAAVGFGVPGEAAPNALPWLYAKGVRDIACGLFTALLIVDGKPHPLGAFLVAASLIPVADAVIVLRSGGARGTAYGIHGVTAALLAAVGVSLLAA